MARYPVTSPFLIHFITASVCVKLRPPRICMSQPGRNWDCTIYVFITFVLLTPYQCLILFNILAGHCRHFATPLIWTTLYITSQSKTVICSNFLDVEMFPASLSVLWSLVMLTQLLNLLFLCFFVFLFFNQIHSGYNPKPQPRLFHYLARLLWVAAQSFCPLSFKQTAYED